MLNIISRSIVSKHTRGPHKVVRNLIKGLDDLGYPYVVNASLDATDTLWIHDDPVALIESMKLPSKVGILAGPNIFTLPSEIPSNIDMSRIVWIHPATWVQNFWNISTGKKITSSVWPVGIDINNFSPKADSVKNLIIIYNKSRTEGEINKVCDALKERQEKFKVVKYGEYTEADYLELLDQAKGIIWVGRSESQGIGLLEALAMNVPALIWDIKKFGQWTGTGNDKFNNSQLNFTEATTAPYFDASCGIIFKDETELESNLNNFLTSLDRFSPRKYVETNLSLAKQAQEFLDIYINEFNKTEDSLRNKELESVKLWRNHNLFFKLKTRTKDAIRSIIS